MRAAPTVPSDADLSIRFASVLQRKWAIRRPPSPSLASSPQSGAQKGIAGTYTFEVAEEKQSEVLLMAKIEEHPLRVEVERA